ncbi:TetR/AcrR family transcriptional repressor of nem operon [Chitinivorax tropicus]|uniref:TetR/AcrR family transcriptional repressor of nem operon n=1 Tax=Chitinivorax tropicus TaxID=714531 RepID=A0A840MH12_9PROT|nr:TetR/AcrR family transcriptional regulator [Chitinivorax tropicus]MBB5016815.1 TetR/AcrR family transcriptional repressor of nem operon [Chitinivorax tropicus]
MRTQYADTRDHILSVGESIILGKGFAAVGLSEILTSAEVPKGSFYHYFKSKEQFGVALLQRYFDEYSQQVARLLNDEQLPAAERLMRYWHAWFAKLHHCKGDAQCLAVKLAGEVSDLSEPMREALRLGMESVIHHIGCCIQAGQQDGSIPVSQPAHQLAHVLYQLWLGASLLAKVQKDCQGASQALLATRQLLGRMDMDVRVWEAPACQTN